jgi:hypothetical protein
VRLLTGDLNSVSLYGNITDTTLIKKIANIVVSSWNDKSRNVCVCNKIFLTASFLAADMKNFVYNSEIWKVIPSYKPFNKFHGAKSLEWSRTSPPVKGSEGLLPQIEHILSH